MATTTALYHDGSYNYQTDFGGNEEQAIARFLEDMKKRKVVWGRLFVARTGRELAFYQANEKPRITA